MKHILIICGLLATISTTAQTISLTIINEIDTDMAFFDVFTINTSTGDVKTIGKHLQAFNGIICFTRLKASENVELVIQKRTHPERELLDEFSARVHFGDTNSLSVIEPSELFRVVQGMTVGEAIQASANLPTNKQ